MSFSQPMMEKLENDPRGARARSCNANFIKPDEQKMKDE
jgi:hypothetical protein